MRPGAGDDGQATDRMHLRRPVPRAGEAVAEPQEAALRGAVQPGELDDPLFVDAGDPGGPGRRPGPQVLFKLLRHVGEARHVVAVGIAFGEQHMHDGAGQRAVGAGPGRQMHVRPLRRAGAVGIDHDQLGAALLPRLG